MPRHVAQRLNLDHLVFYRAWMEGTFDLQYLAERYLETGDNKPAAKRTLRAVQDALIAAAKRAGKHGQARLLRLDKDALNHALTLREAEDGPTFEAYVATHDPDGHFSHEEMWANYNDAHGSDQSSTDKTEERKEKRNVRLAQRRIILISELADLLAQPPRHENHINGWFDETITRPLLACRIQTLGQLIDFANDKGFRWHRFIPRLGPARANRVTAWLKKHENPLGKSLTAFATTSSRQLPKAGFGERPEYLPAHHAQPKSNSIAFSPGQDGLYTPPAQLDGSQGRNRARHEENRTRASNDYEAIQEWLSTFNEPRHQHTQRSYRSAAERLLLWAVLVKQVPFSGLSTADVIEFKAFLENPVPYPTWVSERAYARYEPAWRPFVWRKLPKSQRNLPGQAGAPTQENYRRDESGQWIVAGLSDQSIKQSITILSGLCSWLVGQRYLDYNPFSGMSKKKSRTEINIGRSFTQRQWEFLMQVLRELPEDKASTFRLRFVLHLAYVTGLRLSELVQATTGHITVRDYGEEYSPMILSVLGKGQVVREVILPQSLQHSMGQYLENRGLPTDPRACLSNTPLIANVYKGKAAAPITSSALYRILVDFFDMAADKIPDTNSLRSKEDQYRLRQASTHWLRHTHGTHAVARGVSLGVIKKNMGHKSLTTTSIYIQAEERLQAQQMEAFDQDVFTDASRTD